MTALGRLVAVPVREVWMHEANDFTPWLAKPENIALLAETLGLGEVDGQVTEQGVGRFSADIVARDDAGGLILIENQLDQTDHRHLGQVLTYLAGLEGEATVIWIATKFLEEHRAAIDWLNSNTTDRFDFFGVEIELKRIGDSAPAPLFSIVAKPNNWSRYVAAASREASSGEPAERHKIRMKYWASFAEFLQQRSAPFNIRRLVKDHWFSFPIGRSGVVISCTINTNTDRMGVELYIRRDDSKAGIRQLALDKATIENEFSEPLDWQELPGKRASRIAVFRSGIDVADQANYPMMHEWMLDRMLRFKHVFGDRVRTLDLSATVGPDVEADADADGEGEA
jgi:hypothetical protein